MPGVPRVATRDTVVDDGEEEERGGGAQKKMKKILEGQMVFVATSKAAMDPTAFPEPEKLDPYRPLSSYILLGHVSVFFSLFPHFFFLSFFSRKGDSIGPSFLLRSSTRRTCSRGNFETSFQIEKSSTRGGA